MTLNKPQITTYCFFIQSNLVFHQPRLVCLDLWRLLINLDSFSILVLSMYYAFSPCTTPTPCYLVLLYFLFLFPPSSTGLEVMHTFLVVPLKCSGALKIFWYIYLKFKLVICLSSFQYYNFKSLECLNVAVPCYMFLLSSILILRDFSIPN